MTRKQSFFLRKLFYCNSKVRESNLFSSIDLFSILFLVVNSPMQPTMVPAAVCFSVMVFFLFCTIGAKRIAWFSRLLQRFFCSCSVFRLRLWTVIFAIGVVVMLLLRQMDQVEKETTAVAIVGSNYTAPETISQTWYDVSFWTLIALLIFNVMVTVEERTGMFGDVWNGMKAAWYYEGEKELSMEDDLRRMMKPISPMRFVDRKKQADFIAMAQPPPIERKDWNGSQKLKSIQDLKSRRGDAYSSNRKPWGRGNSRGGSRGAFVSPSKGLDNDGDEYSYFP